MQDYWQRQTADKPLFPDMLWSRPENRAFAGKLLIVGGNQFGFAAPAEAFADAEKAGIGVARVVLPDSLHRTVGRVFAAGEYAPSTPSGSFAQKALAEVLSMAHWADGVLLAGDVGRNSETAILFEKLSPKYAGQLTAVNDAADYFITTPEIALNRPDTLLVLNFSQAQKLFVQSHFPQALTSDMDFIRLVEALHDFTKQHKLHLMLEHNQTIFVAVDGTISSTKQSESQQIPITKVAANAAVWWLQNPAKTYAALTMGAHQATAQA